MSSLAPPAGPSSLRSPGKRTSPSKKKLPSGFTASEAASIRANYELETRSRRAELESHMTEALANLKSKLDAEMDRVPACIHHLSVRDFLLRWKGDLVKAAEDTLKAGLEQEHQQSQAKTQSETAQRSPKKRKRNVGESQQNAHVPPSPALPQAKRHAPNPFFTSAAAGPSTTAAPASTSHNTSTTGRTRRPRKNEHIQAFSLNGSPLGVSTWPSASGSKLPPPSGSNADPGPMSVPSSDFTFRMTLDSFAQGLRRELQGAGLGDKEKADLKDRLMHLVQELQS